MTCFCCLCYHSCYWTIFNYRGYQVFFWTCYILHSSNINIDWHSYKGTWYYLSQANLFLSLSSTGARLVSHNVCTLELFSWNENSYFPEMRIHYMVIQFTPLISQQINFWQQHYTSGTCTCVVFRTTATLV